MSCGNNCDAERPDILRSTIHIGDLCKEKCPDCTDECEVLPKECDCPYGHLSGTCVHYTGCDLFTSEIRSGDTFDAVLTKIEKRFCEIQQLFEAVKDENRDLKNELSNLKQSLSNEQGCTNWTQS